MIPVLVWGAPDLPDIDGDHQGVDPVKATDRRIKTALFAVATTLMISVFAVPMASGAAQNSFAFVNQPQDAEVGETITASDLVDGTSFVQVKLVDEAGNTVLNDKILVTFVLDTSPGSASGTLQVMPQPLVAGVATFGPGTLRILTENEPQFTGYRLIPRSTKNPIVTGPASNAFDIWEDGESCGAGDTCEAFLRGTNDQYSLSASGTLGASDLVGVLPGLTCPGQDLIFDNRVFSYATTETDSVEDTPVFLSNHITRADWRASANNGQAHADWCIGLPTAAPWENNGASYREVDVNGAAAGGVLFVALAPKCPSQNPSGSAPCIVSQTGDGMGGSISIGWLPGGDPPRRT